MTAVTPTDHPKSVRNCCVIEVFGGVFYVDMMLFGFLCGCRGFCHRTESGLILFLIVTQSRGHKHLQDLCILHEGKKKKTNKILLCCNIYFNAVYSAWLSRLG